MADDRHYKRGSWNARRSKTKQHKDFADNHEATFGKQKPSYERGDIEPAKPQKQLPE